MEVTKPEKIVANFRSQFSYQNAILLIKFHVGGWVGGGGGGGLSLKNLKFRLNNILRHSVKRNTKKFSIGKLQRQK